MHIAEKISLQLEDTTHVRGKSHLIPFARFAVRDSRSFSDVCFDRN